MHDVVIVGASVAGCTAAILYARQGLRVALVERNPSPDAYKKLCTHFIQSSALPVIERLGLAAAIEARGGLPNALDLHTRWGLAREDGAEAGHPAHGYNIRRSTLDPLLRETATLTPGVEVFLGHAARGLVVEDGRVEGVVTGDRDGTERTFRGRLVVAADGRHSPLAGWAGVPTRQTRNARFFYYAHYRGLDPNGGRSRMWTDGSGIAYTFPNDDGITVAAVTLPKARLPAFKADPEAALREHMRGLPGGPDLAGAERVSPVMGFVDMPNIRRTPAVPGLALLGDAAMSLDPVWGSGCTWAFRSAEWLVDLTAPAIARGTGIDRTAKAYARRHRKELGGHAWHIQSYATGRDWWLPERMMIEAAVHDPACARHLFAYSTRNIGILRFMAPVPRLRAARVVMAARLKDFRARRQPDRPGLDVAA